PDRDRAFDLRAPEIRGVLEGVEPLGPARGPGVPTDRGDRRRIVEPLAGAVVADHRDVRRARDGRCSGPRQQHDPDEQGAEHGRVRCAPHPLHAAPSYFVSPDAASAPRCWMTTFPWASMVAMREF